MNKIKDFTDSERAKWGDVYANLVEGSLELLDVLSQEELNSRFFSTNLEYLKSYLDSLSTADYKASGKGLFEAFKNDDKYKDEVIQYRATIQDKLDKLVNCSRCKCSRCVINCEFKSCSRCLTKERVITCDLEDEYFIKESDQTVKLWSNDLGREMNFAVRGVLVDNHSQGTYVYLIEKSNPDNQHILEYVKPLSGVVEYLPIENVELLNELHKFFVLAGCDS